MGSPVPHLERLHPVIDFLLILAERNNSFLVPLMERLSNYPLRDRLVTLCNILEQGTKEVDKVTRLRIDSGILTQGLHT